MILTVVWDEKDISILKISPKKFLPENKLSISIESLCQSGEWRQFH